VLCVVVILFLVFILYICVFYFTRELLQERTKVTALSEELENPMNVHRWRKLEGDGLP
jgi:hypothetical protein